MEATRVSLVADHHMSLIVKKQNIILPLLEVGVMDRTIHLKIGNSSREGSEGHVHRSPIIEIEEAGVAAQAIDMGTESIKKGASVGPANSVEILFFNFRGRVGRKIADIEVRRRRRHSRRRTTRRRGSRERRRSSSRNTSTDAKRSSTSRRTRTRSARNVRSHTSTRRSRRRRRRRGRRGRRLHSRREKKQEKEKKTKKINKKRRGRVKDKRREDQEGRKGK